MRNKVLLRGAPLRDEGVAAAGITPGMLVERDGSDQVQAHSGAGLSAAPIFALEREMTGDGLDVAYVASDTVLLAHCRRGDMVQAAINIGTPAITVGTFLESDGAGGLQPVATDTATSQDERASVVAVAREAVDNSAGGAIVWCKVEIL